MKKITNYFNGITKLIISILGVLVMILSLSSCSNSATKEDEGIPLNIIDDKYRNYYQIYVGSYFDTNNDGIGDLNGVTQKLDYIQDLGYNGIWMLPTNEGTSYHKYDVEDYYNVDPQYGTLEDFRNLCKEAKARGINIMMDLVVNHSSSEHPWFKEACQYIRDNKKPGGKYGDYYVFSETQKSQKYENVGGTKYFYEAQFWSGMPDLNLDSKNVRNEISNIMKFWFEQGVDDFRLDAVTSYYTGNLSKNIEFLSWLNKEAKRLNPDCYLVGEAWIDNMKMVREYYKSGIDSFFCFPLATGGGRINNILNNNYDGGKMFGDLVNELQNTFDVGVLAPFLANHDTGRLASFVGKSQIDKIKMATGLLAMLNGSIYNYYGDEIGMANIGVSDPGKRIAMNWDKGIYSGLCYVSPENIKVDKNSYPYPPVKEQLEDKDSILNFNKAAMKLRNQHPEIARGKCKVINTETKDCVIIQKTYKESTITIVINLGRLDEHKLILDKEKLGYSGLVGSLCANAGEAIDYNAENNEIYLPAYSIAILK